MINPTKILKDAEIVANIKKKLKLLEESRDKTMNQSKANKIKLATAICELYAEGEYTIQSCCDAVDINYYTFIGWARPNYDINNIDETPPPRGFVLEVQEIYKRAVEKNEQNYFKLLKNATRQGLLMKAQGLEYDEVETSMKRDEATGTMMPQMTKVVKKTVLPDTTALIFISKNVDKENFQDRMVTEHSGEVKIGTGLEKLSDEELKLKRAELEKVMETPDGV